MTKEELAYARGAIARADAISMKIDEIDSALKIGEPILSFKAGRNMAEEVQPGLLKEVVVVGLVTLKKALEDGLAAISLNMPRPPSGVVS